MNKTYYYKGLPLFTCAEGSLLDLVIQGTAKQRRERNTQAILKLIEANKPIKLPKPTRDILEVLT